MNEPTSTSTPDALRRSYQNMMPPAAWELDVGDGFDPQSTAEPVPANPDDFPVKTGGDKPRRLPVQPSPPSPLRIIEAMLFVGGPALTPELAVTAIRGLTADSFAETIEELNRAYRRQGRPYAIEKHESGWHLAIRAAYRPLAEKIFGGVKEARLTQPAIDVLATVAYRQPVTKQEVDNVRGHESGALLRQLVRRGLIAVTRRAEAAGREVHYGTTARFLELFALKNLEELPQTEDLQRL